MEKMKKKAEFMQKPVSRDLKTNEQMNEWINEWMNKWMNDKLVEGFKARE